MNKSSWTPLKVAFVDNPTEDDLTKVLSIARDNLGRPVELPFGTGKGYILTAITPPDPSGMGRASYVEWTLIDVANSHLPPLWSHRTTDTATLLNMIHLEASRSSVTNAPVQQGANSPAQLMKTQELSQNFLQPMLQNGNGMADASGTPSGTYATFGVNLSGELADVDLFGVLQSVSICKMTGRLEIVEGMSQIEVFFEDGTPIHATKEDALLVEGASIQKGSDVVLESLMWSRGKFAFTSKINAKERTVSKRMDALLVEAAALRDQKQELEKRGFDERAPLFKSNPNLSEAEFESLVKAGGVPADLSAQKTIYSQLKPGECIHDFLVRIPMPMSIWMPALFNMSMQNILAMQAKGSQPAFKSTGAIDFSVIENAFHEILRPETDMLSYPLFLLFAQREHKLSARTRTGYSVVIFDVKQNGLLPQGKHLRRVVKAFNQVKADLDLVGHFQTLEFGMILPFSNAEKALALCQQLVVALQQLPPDEESEETASAEPQEPEAPLKLSFGIVSVPEDSTDLTKAILLAQSNRQSKPVGRYFEA